MEIRVEKLTKDYGSNRALNEVSVNFENGIYGILGPNGSGKSTMFNIITDNITATSGRVTIDGRCVIEMGREYRALLGYMPQQQGFYEDFTVRMFLRYFAKLKGMKKSTADDVIDEILIQLNLKDAVNKKIKALSGGMKQRVLFAESVLNNPKILILDEPTAGLDPRERINFRNMLAGLAEDRIILLATHIVSDIECIADRVILLKGGVKIGEDTPEGLMESIAGKVFEVKGEREELIELQRETGLGNIMHNQNGLALRVVTDEPKEYYTPVKGSVSLEDVYLYYFEYLKQAI